MAVQSRPPPTDRQILETIVESLATVYQALRFSDSRRAEAERRREARQDEADAAFRGAVISALGELQQAMIALLTSNADEKRAAVEALKKREPSGVHFTFGDGSDENTTRVQLAAPHWAKVRPWVLWFASSLATAIGLGKLFALGAGH